MAYRAAQLASHRPRVLEQTTNHDDMGRMAARAAALGIDLSFGEMLGDDGLPIGLPESEIGWRVDVSGVLDRKRAALAAHGSQSDTQWMLSLPLEAFGAWMGNEYYRRKDVRASWSTVGPLRKRRYSRLPAESSPFGITAAAAVIWVTGHGGDRRELT